MEATLQLHESTATVFRTAAEKHEAAKLAYEKLFDRTESFTLPSDTMPMTDYVAIQERATPASENVEDWVLPIAVGGIGGGLLGALFGLLVSLIIVRSPKPAQIPAAL